MNSEVIIRTLQNHGRAFCRDIAKAAGMENAQAISILLELERLGQVVQKNGNWSLVCAPAAAPANTKQAYSRKVKNDGGSNA
ncbi:hypothetical protein RF847_004629 [Salmonella enterica]|nr:hypothetical protein [Salmonella enterica]